MKKLDFQDAAFFRMESPERPYHVGCLLLFSQPDDAGTGYMRKVADYLVSEFVADEPVYYRKLAEPDNIRSPAWVDEPNIDFDYHVRHYALPQPGRMADLLSIVSRVHAPPLDRNMPLWEIHLIEGLPKQRFAVYLKVHHSLIDGVSGMRLIAGKLSAEPQPTGRRRAAASAPVLTDKPVSGQPGSWLEQLENRFEGLAEQGKALSEVASQMLHMGRNKQRDGDLPPLPFTAPPSILNQEGGSRRRLMTLDLSLKGLKKIGHSAGGTLNDGLVAVCGGALRAYLQEQGALPRSSLLATLPVAIKANDGSAANTLSMIMCPLGTNVADPLKRLQRIVKVTQKAKRDLQGMTDSGRQGMMNLIMLPIMALSLTHTTSRFNPVLNLGVSNVIGPTHTQYLKDARLEAIYPVSFLSEVQALNVTAISYRNKMCMGMIACPDGLDGVDGLPGYVAQAYAELRDAC